MVRSVAPVLRFERIALSSIGAIFNVALVLGEGGGMLSHFPDSPSARQ